MCLCSLTPASSFHFLVDVADNSPSIRYIDTEDVLQKIQLICPKIVLIGGQVIGFWALRYSNNINSIVDDSSLLVSKDIDFAGSHHDVRDCAKLLGGIAKLPDFNGHDATNSGFVQFRDNAGRDQQIDFLVSSYGIPKRELLKEAIDVLVPLPGGQVMFRVMSPEHCFYSRVANTTRLGDAYTTARAITQLRASIAIVKEYTRELAFDSTRVKLARRLVERIFHFAWKHKNAVLLRREHKIECFDALWLGPELGAKFCEKRLPQLQKIIREVRSSDLEPK